MNKVKNIILAIISCTLLPTTILAVEVPISLFPISDYSQNLNQWLKPSSPNYNKSLLTDAYQQQRSNEFYDHLYSNNATSPWSNHYVIQVFTQKENLKNLEQNLINWFSNSGKNSNQIGYGENFRAHSKRWINNISANMNINQFSGLTYNANNRAITVNNLNARVLPTDDPHFNHFTLAGQGYPFDNLQMSSLWAGTPVYIVAQSYDKAWDFIITPSFFAWVHSEGVAKVAPTFINHWASAAKKTMAATIHTKTPIIDTDGNFQFYAFVGSVFPAETLQNNQLNILIPERGKNGFAIIDRATVKQQYLAKMPLVATPHEFSKVLSTLLNRPYGWGGFNFYNDCSQELKSLFTPFGIWLPRHSSDQTSVGKIADMSALKVDQRLQYLLNNGHPLMTVVYIGGHIILYLGNYQNPQSPESPMAMTYQNLWGLSPPSRNRRSVIGESVLLPLLKQYPEDPSLNSLANGKYFQVSFLDQRPTVSLKASHAIDLKSLVYPEHILKNKRL